MRQLTQRKALQRVRRARCWMSMRNLDSLLTPRSVAVVGATDRAHSVGATVWRNLREGGFAGPRWAVNLHRTQLGDEPVVASISSLPQAPELALICTPADTVAGLIEELGQRGTRAAVVLTAGLSAAQKQAMLDNARRHLLRICGPNCLGLLSPHEGLNASFAHIGAQPGGLAFVSQSGAMVTAVLDWAQGRGIGFSRCISLGEHADVDFGDLLDWLAVDVHTRAILLYVESVQAARKFMSAARGAARNKPVLVVKAGRSAWGQAAAASHTGALAGSDGVYDAAIRRAGMLRVDTLDDLFVAAETLAHFCGSMVQAAASTERLTLLTNGGGAGVMAADAAAFADVALAPLSEAALRSLNAVLPSSWSRANPIDIIGDAPVERYVQTLQTLLATPDAGTVLFMHAPTAIVPSAEIAAALLPIAKAAPGRVLACWLGDGAVRAARDQFQDAGIACFDTPEAAVRAFAMVLNYRCNQQQLQQTPPAQRLHAPLNLTAVRSIIDAALAQGREMLSEPEAKALLAACGVPVVGTQVVAPNVAAALLAANTAGYPVVLKILSPQISHKSDVGGVALDLADEAALRSAAMAMLQRVAQLRPDAQVSGFTVQPMVRRPQALELIVGSTVDPLFGPVILFGQGGTAVEVLADHALALPPLNEVLAQALVARTRVAKLLQGWRDVPAADAAAVTDVLLAVSELLALEPRIAEIDINPLLADAQGVVALDARVRVSAAAPGGAAHFAIAPYPNALSETWDWQGRVLTVRPIQPTDEVQHLAFLRALAPEDVRLRVFYTRRSIEHSELARLTQIDYDREMAFIATTLDAQGQEQTLGAVRAISDPDNQDAEFGVIVRSDLKRAGLGHRLMQKLISYQRSRGTQRMVALVLVENTAMLHLAQRLGFSVDMRPDDPGVRHIQLALQS
jgi:acetyltransferase